MCRKLLRCFHHTFAIFCSLAALGIGALWTTSYAQLVHCTLGPGEMDRRPKGPSWYLLLSADRGWVGATLTRHTPWRVWIPPNDRSAWPLPPQGVELSGQEPNIIRLHWPFIATSGRFWLHTWSEVQHKRWKAFRDMGDNSSVPLDLDDPRDGWVIAQRSPDVFWVPTHVRKVVYVNVCLPLWLLFAIIAGYPAWSIGSLLSRRRKCKRRQKAGLCQQCDYDLTGNVSSVCPECGTKIQNDKTSRNRDGVPTRGG